MRSICHRLVTVMPELEGIAVYLDLLRYASLGLARSSLNRFPVLRSHFRPTGAEEHRERSRLRKVGRTGVESLKEMRCGRPGAASRRVYRGDG